MTVRNRLYTSNFVIIWTSLAIESPLNLILLLYRLPVMYKYLTRLHQYSGTSLSLFVTYFLRNLTNEKCSIRTRANYIQIINIYIFKYEKWVENKKHIRYFVNYFMRGRALHERSVHWLYLTCFPMFFALLHFELNF